MTTQPRLYRYAVYGEGKKAECYHCRQVRVLRAREWTDNGAVGHLAYLCRACRGALNRRLAFARHRSRDPHCSCNDCQFYLLDRFRESRERGTR